MTAPAVRAAGRWLVRLVLVAFLAVVLGAVAVLIVIPRATHGVALTVLTGSMTPTIPVGSTVIDRPVDTRTLHVGDIATYQKTAGKAEFITHRIVAINTSTTPTTFTFKGDANRGPDVNPVPATAIRGKVWFHVPYLGAIHDSLRSGGLRSVALVAIIVALGGYCVAQLVSVGRQRRGRHAKSGSEPELVLELPRDAFGAVDPEFVARLLGGRCEVGDATLVLTCTGSTSRLAVVRELLLPYGAHEPAHAQSADAQPADAQPADAQSPDEDAVLADISLAQLLTGGEPPRHAARDRLEPGHA